MEMYFSVSQDRLIIIRGSLVDEGEGSYKVLEMDRIIECFKGWCFVFIEILLYVIFLC